MFGNSEERAARREEKRAHAALHYTVFIPAPKSIGVNLTVDGEAGTIRKGSEKRGETRPLDGVTVSVESAGSINRRVTLTRAAALGVFALAAQKKVDDREILVLVDGPDFQWVLPVDAKYSSQVRQRVSRITTSLREWQSSRAGGRPLTLEAQPAVPELEAPTVQLPPAPSRGRHSR